MCQEDAVCVRGATSIFLYLTVKNSASLTTEPVTAAPDFSTGHSFRRSKKQLQGVFVKRLFLFSTNQELSEKS